MSNEEMKLRLECLKRSYEKQHEISKDLHDVFSLADMHIQYVIYGNIPLDDEEGDIENDLI